MKTKAYIATRKTKEGYIWKQVETLSPTKEETLKKAQKLLPEGLRYTQLHPLHEIRQVMLNDSFGPKNPLNYDTRYVWMAVRLNRITLKEYFDFSSMGNSLAQAERRTMVRPDHVVRIANVSITPLKKVWAAKQDPKKGQNP